MGTSSTAPPESNIELVVEESIAGENFSAVQRRISHFLQAGVKNVWLLDAAERSVGVWSSGGRLTVVTEDLEEAGEVDPGLFPCTLEQLFGPSPGAFPLTVQRNVRRILEFYSLRRISGIVKPPEEQFLIGFDQRRATALDLCFHPTEPTANRVGRRLLFPLLAIAIQAPGEKMRPVYKQLIQYQRLGIPLVWWVHVEEQFVVEFQPGTIMHVLDDEEELTGHSVLPDFRCRVAEFFSVPGRQRATPGAPS